MPNPHPKTEQRKPFVKGDPRINRKGVPTRAILMREFIAQVGAEKLRLPAKDGEPSEEVTRFYAMVRRMFSSSNPRDRELVLKSITPDLLKENIELDALVVEKDLSDAEALERLMALAKKASKDAD